VKKELLLYLFFVLITALLFHPDLLSEPEKRLEMMSDRGNYYHPFLFGFGIYLGIGILRLFAVGVKKIVKRRSGKTRKH
jgi:hypothetical protein